MKRGLVLAALMCVAALCAYVLKPKTLLADQLPPINLETMVPTSFGDWHAVQQTGHQVVNPQAQVLVNTLYQEVLNRVYVNQSGYTIMLSIAYGRNQRDGLDVHKPEICYPAQGFQLKTKESITLALPGRNIAATRLATQQGQRLEPVTYWIVLGDQVTRGGLDKKLKEMRYSLMERTLPDGMLVRVSSIDGSTVHAYQTQAHFLTALVGAIAPVNRARFAGSDSTQ